MQSINILLKLEIFIYRTDYFNESYIGYFTYSIIYESSQFILIIVFG